MKVTTSEARRVVSGAQFVQSFSAIGVGEVLVGSPRSASEIFSAVVAAEVSHHAGDR